MFARWIALAAIIFLIKQFLYPHFKIVTKKHRKQVRKYAKTQNEEEKKYRSREKRRKIARVVTKPFISEQKAEELGHLLVRLNKDRIPEEVILDQIIIIVAGALVAYVMFTANLALGLISTLLILLGWFAPVDELRKEFEKKNTSIALDFPEFYSMVFYQYSKAVNIFLSDVVRDYLPNANEDLADELGVMLDNINYADETYALRQLKKRVPKHFIIKFCDLMETRLRGYDNVSQMQYLKNDIDAFRISELEKELARRKRKNDMIQVTLICVLVLYITMYFIFTTLGALRMFQ